jgi:hypothetical protein
VSVSEEERERERESERIVCVSVCVYTCVRERMQHGWRDPLERGQEQTSTKLNNNKHH